MALIATVRSGKAIFRHRNQIPGPETVHRITSLTAWQANPTDILAPRVSGLQVEGRRVRAVHVERGRVVLVRDPPRAAGLAWPDR